LFGAVPDVGYQTNPTKELRQLYDRTVRLQSADLALRRTGVENFQNSHNEHKLTPEEANFQKDSDQASSYYKAVSRKTSFVKARPSSHGAASRPIHLPVSSSARREVNKGHDTPHIGDIYMLHAAGQKDDLVTTSKIILTESVRGTGEGSISGCWIIPSHSVVRKK